MNTKGQSKIEPANSTRKRLSSTYIEYKPGSQLERQGDKEKNFPDKEIGSKQNVSWPFVVYQIVICIPIFVYIGGYRLAPYKIFLLLAFLPCILKMFFSARKEFNIGDALISGYTVLSIASIINGHSSENTLEPILSNLLETSGSYFLARAFVTSPRAFEDLIRTQLFLVVFVGLFSVYESISGMNVLFQFFGTVFQTIAFSDMALRLGLHRAQGTFEHPILYGVYSSTIFGLCFYGLKNKITNIQRYGRLALVILATFVSLSTGAYISIAGQLAFIGWDKFITFTKHKWRLLIGLCVLAYFLVDGLSSRNPFQVFITYLTFDSNTSYNRVLIWIYGLAEVWRNPLLGKGLFVEWIRPVWMVASIDNFFLLRAMRHGLPATALLIGLILWNIVKLSNLKVESQLVRNYRNGFLVTVGGLLISLITVDLWSGLYSYFFFLFGSSVWMINYSKTMQSLEPSTSVSDTDRRFVKKNDIVPNALGRRIFVGKKEK
jgi:hypothetical protein